MTRAAWRRLVVLHGPSSARRGALRRPSAPGAGWAASAEPASTAWCPLRMACGASAVRSCRRLRKRLRHYEDIKLCTQWRPPPPPIWPSWVCTAWRSGLTQAGPHGRSATLPPMAGLYTEIDAIPVEPLLLTTPQPPFSPQCSIWAEGRCFARSCHSPGIPSPQLGAICAHCDAGGVGTRRAGSKRRRPRRRDPGNKHSTDESALIDQETAAARRFALRVYGSASSHTAGRPDVALTNCGPFLAGAFQLGLRIYCRLSHSPTNIGHLS
jgi:hypothetical protein